MDYNYDLNIIVNLITKEIELFPKKIRPEMKILFPFSYYSRQLQLTRYKYWP